MKCLVFLQNAWSPKYAGKVWPRRSWLKALHESRTGQRLRSLTSGYCFAGVTWYFENASPIVGADPDAFCEADIHHMRCTMLRQKPDVVIALGKEAHRGALIGCADAKLTIVAPHPASRVLTNDLYLRIGRDLGCLNQGFVPVQSLIAFKQERGRVIVHPDPWLIPERKAWRDREKRPARDARDAATVS